MTLSDGIEIGAIIVVALIVSRASRSVLTRILRIVAKRGLEGRGRWQNRLTRLRTESSGTAELRRQQRIEATALALSRAFNIVVWTLAVVLVLEAADIDPVFAISAAGFLGVALAIGGQNAVNDFVTGLQFLIEDRLGEGDSVRVKVHDEVLQGVVGALGAFSTRFELPDSTVHVANRELTLIVNLSQHGVSTELVLADGEPARVADLEHALRDRYRAAPGYDASADGLVIDRVRRRNKRRVATVRTARPLTDIQRDVITRSVGRSPGAGTGDTGPAR